MNSIYLSLIGTIALFSMRIDAAQTRELFSSLRYGKYYSKKLMKFVFDDKRNYGEAIKGDEIANRNLLLDEKKVFNSGRLIYSYYYRTHSIIIELAKENLYNLTLDNFCLSKFFYFKRQ